MSPIAKVPPAHLLVIDHEVIAMDNLVHLLDKEGYQVTGCQSGPVGMAALERNEFDVVLTDLRMDQVDGMAILKYCRERYPDCAVIMITGHATLGSAVAAMKEGAYHYIAKPYWLDEVREVVKSAVHLVHLRRENRQLRRQVEELHGPVDIITLDPAMLRLLEMARQIAPSGVSVLITGESGTGKELLARYLHAYGGRQRGPFVAINCGAFNEELLANELFGHEKGAFTGAVERKRGLILKNAYEEARNFISDAKRQINAILEETKREKKRETQKKLAETERNGGDKLKEFAHEPALSIEEIKKGDVVFVKSIGYDAEVIAIDRKHQHLKVKMGNKEIEVPITDISHSKGKLPEKEAKDYIYDKAEETVQVELNIIGSRVDEALSGLEPFLNHASIENLSEVTIIHGVGTGALMKAVRNYLKDHPLVNTATSSPTSMPPTSLRKRGQAIRARDFT